MNWKQIISFGLTAMAGGLLAVGVYKMSESHFSSQDFAVSTSPRFAALDSEGNALPDFRQVAGITRPAVVHVKSKQNKSPQSSSQQIPDPFKDFFGDRGFQFEMPGQNMPREGSGSGVLISSDGYIVTNNHVIEGADELEVILNDKRSYSAKVVGADPSTDLALLKISEKDLPYLSFGNSDEVEVGEWVLAIGNPFNLTSTVTAGIVSAKARNLNLLNDKFRIESFIQTDAAVNPGNSGGALVNSRGQLIGINTAIASQTGSYAGYSFAVPSLMANKVMNDLKEFGTVQRGFLGVSIRDVDAQFAESEGLKVLKGVYVQEVNENSAALAAGLKKGDVITAVDGVSVASSSELQEQIGRRRPGDKVGLKLFRGEEEKTYSVTLKSVTGETGVVKKTDYEMGSLLGADFSSCTEQEFKDAGVKSGVKVNKLRAGKLQSSGMKEGFIITAIDKKMVYKPSEVEAILRSKQGGVLIEGIYPDGTKAYYAIGL
jgi:serine protease Do